MQQKPEETPERNGLQDLASFFFWLGNAQNEIIGHTYLSGRKEGAYDMALVALESRFCQADDETKVLLWHASTETRRDFVCFLRLRENDANTLEDIIFNLTNTTSRKFAPWWG